LKNNEVYHGYPFEEDQYSDSGVVPDRAGYTPLKQIGGDKKPIKRIDKSDELPKKKF
jgi:hypothetical protein